MRSLLKKLFYSVIAGGAYFLIIRFLSPRPAESTFYFSYAQPFMVFLSIVVDPIVGGLGFALGEYLAMIGGNNIDGFFLFCCFLNGAGIGLFFSPNDLRQGFFSKKDIIQFNSIQLLSNFIVWSFFYPLYLRMFKGTDFVSMHVMGLRYALGFSISCLVAGSLFLAIYAQSRFSEANFYRS